MSVPHSVVHAASYDEVEKHPGTTAAPPPKKEGKKGMVSDQLDVDACCIEGSRAR